MTRADEYGEMPYRRDGGCELCGARDVALHRIVLEEASGGRNGGDLHLTRALYVCDQHKDAEGEPPGPPRRRMAPGTTRLKPQKDGLL
jgi:hypothetical protein